MQATPEQLIRMAQNAAAAIAATRQLLPDALTALDDNRNGFPTRSVLGGSRGSHSSISPTEQASELPDRATADLERLVAHFDALDRAATDALNIVTTWAP